MPMDRRVFPALNSVGSDLFTVLAYDPIFQTCDLSPASANQRGILTKVPISQSFGGAWELQNSHQPPLNKKTNAAQWGNGSRGARWGSNFPIQTGDFCRVMYLGESMSDPIITQFYRARGDYGVPWVANQVLSRRNDYTEATPDDDDLVADRYDNLLPSGAWMRSTQAGSWVFATAPVDRPKAWFSLDAKGKIKLKARGDEQYTIHLEFDANTQQGRIAIGESLEAGSYIEFKDGDINIRAKGKLNLFAQQVKGDVRAQGASATECLLSNPSSQISDQELPAIVSQAAGEMVLQSIGGSGVPSGGNVVLKPDLNSILGGLFSNPAIDGDLRGRIQDLALHPDSLLQDTLGHFKNGLNDLEIGKLLGQVLGSQALMGSLPKILSSVDLTALPMIKELGVPSWIGKAIQDGIQGGNPLQIALSVAPELTDNQLIDKVCQFVGGAALNGGKAPDARSLLNDALGLLDGGLKDRIKGLLPLIGQLPIPTPKDDSGNKDWTRTAAQRLGSYILRGGDLLGGKIDLFGKLDFLNSLGLDDRTSGNVQRVARQIEQFAAHPHHLLDVIPEAIAPYVQQIAQIPPEVRNAILKLPQSLIGQVPDVLAVSDPNAQHAHGDELHGPHFNDLRQAGLGAILTTIPDSVRQLMQSLPGSLFQDLGNLLPRQLKPILENPSALLENLDTDMIQNLFGGITSSGAGVFDVQVMKKAVFNALPQLAPLLKALDVSSFHPQTEATPIEHYLEYGELNMPDWFVSELGQDRDGNTITQ